MKANELMIGDWIKISSQFAQIYDVGHNTIGVQFSDGYDVFEPKSIEPIPLTIEILESNGFEKKGHRYGIYDDYFDFEMYEYNDGTWLVTYHCCEMSLPDEQVMLFHVHQLQHFMHHCGIEKEITLKLEP